MAVGKQIVGKFSGWPSAQLRKEKQELEDRVQKVIELHKTVIDFDVSGEEVEHCDECGYIGTNELDDYCPTVRILRGWPL